MSHGPLPSSIAIFGPGLLGGSLALAIETEMPSASVRVWARREAAAEEVRSRGLAKVATTSVVEAASGAEFIILATPVDVMIDLAKQIATCDVGENCVVTDVGSVKGLLVPSLESAFAGSRASFVGSHPMAGSEKTGLDAARPDLFRGACCIVTPTEATNDSALTCVKTFWSALGCRLLSMSPDVHDRKVARISHLPHVMAAVTTLAALRPDATALDCAAGGFRDTTRVAAGDPGLWTGILRENRAEVIAALRDALGATRELLEIVEGFDEEALRLFLAEAKTLRDRLTAGATAYGND